MNAPLRLRLFEFEPGLAGDAGIKAAEDAQQAAAPDAGHGWLYIRVLGLIRREKSEHAVTAVDAVLQTETLYRIVTQEPN